MSRIITIFVLFLCQASLASDELHGAYRMADGEVLAISSFNGKQRFFMQNGRTGSLDSTGDNTYAGGEPELEAGGATHTLTLAGDSLTLNWDGSDRLLTPVPLKIEDHTFSSADVLLQGRLVIPADGHYRGVVILVHGSERYSALENNYLPYIFAANELAVFVYDKRGTGRSGGDYTLDISQLADDLVAAIAQVGDIAELSGQPILLAGFSQGGWVAPLAALESGKVQGLFVGYGPAVAVSEEDRWGYVYWLQKEGYSAQDIANADQLFYLLTDMRSRGTPDRWKELKPLIKQYRGEKWFREGIAGTDSSLAVLSDTPIPLTLMYWWTSIFGLDQFTDYDPMPVLSKLDIPGYWVFAGEDASVPTPGSIENLEQLIEEGKPFAYKVYPDTSHGIVVFSQREGRQRDFVAYHPDYYSDMIRWLQTRAAAANRNDVVEIDSI
jgi:pimeloyl-ACP methyl ester carboxylesterase